MNMIKPLTYPLLTPSMARKQLHCSRNTIYRLLDTGKLPSVRYGRHRRIRQEDVDTLAATGWTPVALRRRPLDTEPFDPELTADEIALIAKGLPTAADYARWTLALETDPTALLTWAKPGDV